MLLGIVLVALAAPPTCAGDLRAVEVTQGSLAPFTGQLLTPDLAVCLGQRADGAEKRFRLDLDHQLRLAAIDLQHEQRLHQIDLEADAQEKDALQRALEAATPPFYERPAFTIPATVAVVVTFILLVK